MTKQYVIARSDGMTGPWGGGNRMNGRILAGGRHEPRDCPTPKTFNDLHWDEIRADNKAEQAVSNRNFWEEDRALRTWMALPKKEQRRTPRPPDPQKYVTEPPKPQHKCYAKKCRTFSVGTLWQCDCGHIFELNDHYNWMCVTREVVASKRGVTSSRGNNDLLTGLVIGAIL